MTAALHLAMIGTGSMGGALLTGMLAAGESAGASAQRTVATTKSAASAQGLRERLGVTALALDDDGEANAAAVRDADFVFLGVKPWLIRETLNELRDVLSPNQVLVSMAAGISLATLEELAPSNPVVRIMPNTPSSIGHGVIALAPDAAVTPDQVSTLHALLSGAGQVFEVTEAQLGAMIGIAGSGVAYFFLLAEEMVKAGVQLGLDQETARQMVVGTAEGAGRLLATDPDPAKLRAAVTSKGGTTHAAITRLQQAGLEGIVGEAAKAAAARASEMEQENA